MSTPLTPPPLFKRNRAEAIVIVIDDSDSEVEQLFKRSCFTKGEVIVISDDDDDNVQKEEMAIATTSSTTSVEAVATVATTKNDWQANHPANFYLTYDVKEFTMMCERDYDSDYDDDDSGDYYEGLTDDDARAWVNLHHGANLYAYYSSLPPGHAEYALCFKYAYYRDRLVTYNQTKKVQVLVEILEQEDDADQIHTWCKVPAAFRVQMARAYGVNELNVGAWLRFVVGYQEPMTASFARNIIESFAQHDTSIGYRLTLEQQLIHHINHQDPKITDCFKRFTLRRMLQQLPWLPIELKGSNGSKRVVGVFRQHGFDIFVMGRIFEYLHCFEDNRVA